MPTETIYASGDYVTPNAIRSERKRKRGEKTKGHVAQKEARRTRVNVDGVDRLPDDPLADVFMD